MSGHGVYATILRSRDASGKDQWDTVYSYLQRAVIPLKAQLTVGDSSAPADVFDSMPFRGVQLASDDDMLPDSLKGYAPVVRGVARTNAGGDPPEWLSDLPKLCGTGRV